MHSLPSNFPTAKSTRITAILIAAFLWAGASLQTASAADALSSTTTYPSTLGRGWISSLFHKDYADKYAAPHGGANRLNRSILALPVQILTNISTKISRYTAKQP